MKLTNLNNLVTKAIRAGTPEFKKLEKTEMSNDSKDRVLFNLTKSIVGKEAKDELNKRKTYYFILYYFIFVII